MYTHPLLDRDKMTPEEALSMLIEGNERFVSNTTTKDRDVHSIIQLTKEKQHPFASFLSCSDSRAPVELVFDQALGDIFSVRMAGNIASDKAIGSLEFACKYLGSKMIVVMGHTSCGAVKAACDNFMDGHIGEIINLIKPAIRHEKTVFAPAERSSKNPDFVEKVNRLSVQYQIDTIIRSSDILQDMLKAKQIGIIGASYDISNGRATFFENTFVS